MRNPILSICVPVYNHEKYIIQALDSILMQETKYTYEVLVGEDCSTDNTREILRKYEAEHPGRFQMFYRERNMRNEKYSNSADLRLRSKGKYLIILEGDDYWTDNKKLDKQISFLESHPDYIAVSHNCIVVDENSEPNGERYPECKNFEYTFCDYRNEILPGQLTTVLMRNFVRNKDIDSEVMYKKLMPADRALYFMLLCNGKIHCIQEKMSAYRHVTSSGSSYSANYKYDYKKEKNLYASLVEYAHRMRNKQAIHTAEVCYFCSIRRGYKRGEIKFSEFLSDIKLINTNLFVILFLCFKRKFYNIFHKSGLRS